MNQIAYIFTLLLDWLFTWLNTHYEATLFIVLFWMGLIFLARLLVSFHLIWIANQQAVIERVLHDCLTAGLAALIFLMGYSCLINFSEKKILDFSDKVTSNTKWVRADFPIYFIADNKLMSIRPNGSLKRKFFEAPDSVLSYHFSPNGRYMLVVSKSALNLVDIAADEKKVVDALQFSPEQKTAGATGVLSGVRWSPDSRKFCYRMAQWGKVSSFDNWIVYDVASGKKDVIKSPTLRMSSLIWDKEGKSLYFLWFQALDTKQRANPYDVKVYQIPIGKLVPEMVLTFPYDQQIVPLNNLALHDIYLFDPDDSLSFSRPLSSRDELVSTEGRRIGIDEHDYLYYIHNRWWKRRLYKVPRVVMQSDIKRYAYGGGVLAIQHLRWLPGGRYVLLDHRVLGTLILEPATGKVGLLTPEQETGFGWYRGVLNTPSGSGK